MSKYDLGSLQKAVLQETNERLDQAIDNMINLHIELEAEVKTGKRRNIPVELGALINYLENADEAVVELLKK